MPLRLTELRALIDPMLEGDPPVSQNEVARRLGIEPSALSRWLDGGGASFPLVAQAAVRLGVDVGRLWSGDPPRRYRRAGVARGTARAVAETPAEAYRTEADADALHAALWTLEQMNLALADISRRARERFRREAV